MDGTPEGALATEPVERVRAILERIVDELDVEASVEVSEDDEEILGKLDGEDLGLVIGRRGQTIDAIQLLCYRAAFRGRQDRKRSPISASERATSNRRAATSMVISSPSRTQAKGPPS